MAATGTIKGLTIELDEPLPFPEGMRVEIEVSAAPRPRPGSPEAVLQLAGTLDEAEAEAILEASRKCRQIDWTLWDVGS